MTADASLEGYATRLDHLAGLGVDWVHVPVFPGVHTGGSTHAGLESLSCQARERGLGILVDIEPSCVAVGEPSPGDWWWDVLQHGRDSQHAAAFDIDWAAGDGQIRIPWLDETVVPPATGQNGELRYLDRRLPLAPGTSRLRDQHYRLVPASSVEAPVNYRRCRGDSDLAAIRVEDREIFDLTHQEVERWFDQGLVDGLCVLHLDDLQDPTNYLYQLAEVTRGAFVLAGKSLGAAEELPPSWAAAGTTGELSSGAFDREVRRAKVDSVLASEIRWIVRELPSAPPVVTQAVDKHAKGLVSRMKQRFVGPTVTPLGHPTEVVIDAVAEIATCFPVARSYLPIGRINLDAALATAAERRPDLVEVINALSQVLRDAEQPAAQRLELATAAVVDLLVVEHPRGSAPWTSVADFHSTAAQRAQKSPAFPARLSSLDLTTLESTPGHTEEILALTLPGLPEVEDLEPGTDELRLAVHAAGLRLRSNRPDLFTSYAPVAASGDAAGHLLAFDRGGAITVATVDAAGLDVLGGWGRTEMDLPAGDWWDHVTGRDLGSDGRVYVAELLDLAPVALLTRDER